MSYDESFKLVKEQISRVMVEDQPAVLQAAELIAKAMANDGILQLLGCGNNSTFAMEMGHRAGGFCQCHQMNLQDLVVRGIVSLEEYSDPDFADRDDVADKLWNTYNIDSRDIFILVQLDRHVKTIAAIARKIKERGQTYIYVTNSQNHLPDQEVVDNADVVIDINLPADKQAIPFTDELSIAPVYGLLGNIVAQMLTAEIYGYMKDHDITPKLLLSANIRGADKHNNDLLEAYLGRYNS